MDLELKGHVALVQGASKGIGRGIAEALAREGCDLLLTARSEAPLRQTAKEIADETGRRVNTYAIDSAELDATQKLLDKIHASYGRFDIIVCNSGGPPPGGLKDLDVEQWRKAADLLLVAPAYLVKNALPLLKESPAPRFFVVTSSSTREPVAGLTLSNTMRPGLVGMIKSLASELGPEGVRCHSIAPGRIDTDRLAAVFEMQSQKMNKPAAAIRQAAIDSIPAARLGSPTDIGSLVAYLSSPRADYLTGGNWLVDGGLIKSI
ncbi:SDR family oxidoreductase [bacterium]|nr:SDR family oxidoreductase [bacterium]